jgi:hypothetical protein
MMLRLERADIEAHFGTVTTFDERIAAFVKAVEDHKSTIDVPAPTEHSIIEHIVRRDGGKYELAAETVANQREPRFDEMRDAKLAEIAAFRWSRQSAGVEYNGHVVGTDAGTLSSLLAYILSDDPEPMNFKIGGTTFVQINLDDARLLVQRIRNAVQAAFDQEAEYVSRVMKARSKKQISEIEAR